MSKPPVDERFAFDPTDTSKSKDFDLMRRIREERPVCRPAEDVVLTTRHADTKRSYGCRTKAILSHPAPSPAMYSFFRCIQ